MAILSIILGVIMAVFGITCMFTPILTFFGLGFFIGIMLLIYAIVGIIRAIGHKTVSVLEIILYIVALVLGILALVHGATLILGVVFLYMIAIWFIFQGIMSIVISIKARNLNRGWYLGLIAGIFGTVVGIIAIFHPLVLAIAIGILVGLYFLVTGVNMISLGIIGEDTKS